ncbi:MAG: DUF484 family protein [Alphaproteobacteria bacterium]|nr:DUF484 family protein [Alphaproteobacteria bacterium]HPF45963.1 DUF484 family protein [Emcibacteraceae bacterium]HRW30435.1 DUF484 family protein [Emcibacteraceae bacterium]
MSGEKAKINDEINALDVKIYLKNNPDFLIKNPDLFSVLTPPNRSNGDEVVDFQNMMIEKIRHNLKELQFNQGHLIDTTRNNLTTQVQVHEAVLSLLDIHDMEQLGHIVTQDWADNLHIDVIRICFEKDHEIAPPELHEAALLSAGSVDEYLGKDDIVQLRTDVEASEEIFGPAKSLVKAEALIKIPATEHNPPGILAFGSRDADMFYPGQGTELLRFLGKSFHKCLIQWLKLKN